MLDEKISFIQSVREEQKKSRAEKNENSQAQQQKVDLIINRGKSCRSRLFRSRRWSVSRRSRRRRRAAFVYK